MKKYKNKLTVGVIIIAVLAFLFPTALTAVTSAFVNAGMYIGMFLMIPALFAAMVLMISALVALVRALGESIANSRE